MRRAREEVREGVERVLPLSANLANVEQIGANERLG